MKDTAEDENPTMTGDIICGNQCDSIETDNTAIFADHTATVFQLGVNADVDEAFSAGIELGSEYHNCVCGDVNDDILTGVEVDQKYDHGVCSESENISLVCTEIKYELDDMALQQEKFTSWQKRGDFY